MKFETKAIHVGQSPDPTTGSIAPSIVTSTTFVQKSLGENPEFVYSRSSSPTRKALEECFASLEEGDFCSAHSSGCASMHLITQFLNPGDVLLGETDLYGGSFRLFNHLKQTQHLNFSLIDFSDLNLLEKKMKELKPKMIWIETPTNPLLKIIDIQKVSQMKPKGSLLVVDNTFASPYFQKPLLLGADIVFHSATKYLGGHSDCLAGLTVTKRKDLGEKLAFFSKTIGPTLSPFDAYLLLRSLKTLSLRMEAHDKNARAVAEFLKTHPKVEQVFYPSLKDHPQFELAQKQMSGFSGVVSFYLKGQGKDVKKFLESLKVFSLGESLGAVESLAEQPLTMTHNSYHHEGITENLIRLSIGIEHQEDLLEDLNQAFKSV